MLLTADFLQAAERSGQSVALGEKVMEMVCRDFQSWHDAGVELYANVRLSARQLLSMDLVERAVRRVSHSKIPRERLTFEFDEVAGSLDEAQIDGNLAGLRAAGFSLALGNFGEGASSLRRLQEVSFLKLSPGLARSSPELCRQALVIAAGLGKVAVGVDVDSMDTARFLVENGCPTIQGTCFSGPLPASEILRLASGNSTWTF